MAVNVDPNQILNLVRFLDKHGTSNMNDYRFVVDPQFRGLNIKIDLVVTHLKSSPQEKIVVTLDP